MTTRGRHPLKAIDAARTIAVRRGLIQYTQIGPGRLCDFEIVCPPLLAKVRMKRMRYIRCTPEWLDREAREEIAGLRMYPSSQEISRELWICSPDYFLRFFRVTDSGLVELGPDGQPLLPKSPKAPRSGRWRATAPSSAVLPGSGAIGPVPAGEAPEPGKP